MRTDELMEAIARDREQLWAELMSMMIELRGEEAFKEYVDNLCKRSKHDPNELDGGVGKILDRELLRFIMYVTEGMAISNAITNAISKAISNASCRKTISIAIARMPSRKQSRKHKR